jgi:DNA (cytosine-5)-methyltransferase 1
VKPRLLDLFCCAGGASRGYADAGFEVVGVDIEAQPRYPFEFVEADAMTYPLNGFDAVHASPPRHDHSKATRRNRRHKAAEGHGTGWMLAATIDRLAASGLPYVVENVENADFPRSVYRVRLCGSSFGLDVQRHRWFASNVPMLQPPCAHHLQRPRFRSLDSRRKAGTLATVVGVHGHLNYAGEFPLRCAAMGIDWMTNDELSQAIPPAYTRFIGEQMIQQFARVAS